MYTTLLEKISTQRAVIGLIGLGYVGLPLAARAGRLGFRVLGFDVSAAKVRTINAGESDVGDVPGDTIAALRQQDRLEATTEMTRLGECDLIIICVPTPLNKTRDPDMSYIEQAANDIAAALRPGQLIVLESTTWPGTTEEIVLPRLTLAGLSVGEDFFLAFSPERIDPGQVSTLVFRCNGCGAYNETLD